jgi:hypothetical protein
MRLQPVKRKKIPRAEQESSGSEVFEKLKKKL